MKLMEHPLYLDSLKGLIARFPHWEAFRGKSFFLSGASGMIGSCLIDAIMLRNEQCAPSERCRVIGASRNGKAAAERFSHWVGRGELRLLAHDIRLPLPELPEQPDYWIHAASTTHPVAYASEPVNTIMANVLGAYRLLEAQKQGNRFLLLSSVEIYGQNRGEQDYFDEAYCGYLDCNTLRADYPEAKRVSETLCQAFIRQNNADAVILRLPRCYGPAMRASDTKALSQFLKKAVDGEDIVLKSAGNQLYSYAHAADAAAGILWALAKGKTGAAYNLGDPGSDISLRGLAAIAAECAGRKVIFAPPDETERLGFSPAQKALMDGSRLKGLGWSPAYGIDAGIRETIQILRDMKQADSPPPAPK